MCTNDPDTEIEQARIIQQQWLQNNSGGRDNPLSRKISVKPPPFRRYGASKPLPRLPYSFSDIDFY